MTDAVLTLAQPVINLPGNLQTLLSSPPALLQMMPVGVYACDAAGRILWFNNRAVRIWGRVPAVGDRAERFCGAEKRYFQGRETSLDETPMATVLRTGEPVREVVGLLERPDGTRTWAMMHIDPVKDSDGTVIGAIACFHDVSEDKRAEEGLRESERRSRELLDALPAAVYTTDAEGRITFFNRAAVELSGREPRIGVDRWCVTWRLLTPDGDPLPHEHCPMAVALRENRPVRGAEAIAVRPDGTRVPFIPFPTPLRDPSGQLVGGVNMLVDITERKRAEERQRALIDEINHRVKNTLATVQSLAAQTISGSGVPNGVRQAFDNRIFALSSVHDQLARAGWESAELSAVLKTLFAHYLGEESDRVRLDGPSVPLPPKAALTLTMVLHELLANAVKHGALSNETGSVALAWRLDGNCGGRRLCLNWHETGAPPVREPARRGFGCRLLERAIERELRGSARLDFGPDGVRARILVPLATRAEV